MIRFRCLALTRRSGGVFLAVVITALSGAATVHAQTESSVVINEVLYDALGSDTGHEWIELFNTSSVDAVLDGWRIERGGTSFATVFTFPSGTRLAPGAFFLVGESSVSNTDFTATLVFQNGGEATDGIRLVDSAGAVVDVLLYDTPNTSTLTDERGNPGTSFAPDAPAGSSLARIPDGADTNAGSDFQAVEAPTPGVPNSSTNESLPSPTATPTETLSFNLAGVVVNEVLPDPVGSDAAGELIELWNTSGNAVDLSGAKLDDADGGSSPYTIPAGTVLAPGAYRSFYSSETKLALNNTGDSARLLTSGGSVAYVLTYGKVPEEGAAWIRINSDAADWSRTPTPGAANVLISLPSEDAEKKSTQTPSPKNTATPRATTGTSTASPAVRAASTRGAAPSVEKRSENTGGGRATARSAESETEEDLLLATPTPSASPGSSPAAPTRRFSLPALLVWVAAGAFGVFRLFARRA